MRYNRVIFLDGVRLNMGGSMSGVDASRDNAEITWKTGDTHVQIVFKLRGEVAEVPARACALIRSAPKGDTK